MVRMLAEAQEDYEKVRKAYHKALEAESYSMGVGTGTRSVSRSKSESLKRQMHAFADEIYRLSNGGIRATPGRPID